MVYSGTGSTGWAQSINQVSFPCFSNLVRNIIQQEVSIEEMERLYLSHKKSLLFSYDNPELRFIHRELFHGIGVSIFIIRSGKSRGSREWI
jgi:hypothetical protein